MKKLAAILILAVPFAFTLTTAHAATEQQNKMATCNKEAADKKGDERKKFMSECLSNKPKASEAQKAQQEKMKTCNAEAKGMKGEEHKKFMSECLKKS